MIEGLCLQGHHVTIVNIRGHTSVATGELFRGAFQDSSCKDLKNAKDMLRVS